MAHQHDRHDDHEHGHAGHGHAPGSFGKAFAIGIGLNAAFVLLEVVFGIASNPLARAAVILAKRVPTVKFTFGLGGASMLAAVFPLAVVGGLSWEAILRVWTPEPVAGTTVLIGGTWGLLRGAIPNWLNAVPAGWLNAVPAGIEAAQVDA